MEKRIYTLVLWGLVGCDPGAELPCADEELVLPATLEGTTLGAGDDLAPACSPSHGEDHAYAFVAPETALYRFDTAGSSVPHSVYVLDSCAGPELACDAPLYGLGEGDVLVPLDAGQSVVVVVDHFALYSSPGPYRLTALQVPPNELECADGLDDDYDQAPDCLDTDCALACPAQCPDEVLGAPPASVSASTLGMPDESAVSCGSGGSPDVSFEFVAPSDGRYLFEASDEQFVPLVSVRDSCAGAELACSGRRAWVDLLAGQGVVVVVEQDAGPGGDFELQVHAIPSSELDCADGLDEDQDEVTDCADSDCTSSCASQCPDHALNDPPDVLLGSTLGQPHEMRGSCDYFSTYNPAPDTSIEFIAPADGLYAFALSTASDFDTILYVLDRDCTGAELACADIHGPGEWTGGEAVAVELQADQGVIVVVDGFASMSGDFELAVFEPEADEGGLCDNDLDDDVDGLVDCADPACVAEAACQEVCDNDLDEDLDLLLDCLDPDCESDSVCAEGCPGQILSGALPLQVVGSTRGSAHDLSGSCTATLGDASDATFSFTAPSDGTYRFDTAGSSFDTLLYVLDGDCSGAELGCNNDLTDLQAVLELELAASQTVIVVLDGQGPGDSGDYVLTVSP